MKKLYAPWRTDYTKRVQTDEQRGTCIFCAIRDTTDDAHEFVLKRSAHCMVMLNKYPYNAGHLLIVPLEHSKELYDYTTEVRGALIEEASKATEILQKTLGAHGCNLGINLGKAAGAGIPEHLHIHVLPRFLGDTNFLPTLADTKQISIDLHKVYEKLLTAYQV